MERRPRSHPTSSLEKAFEWSLDLSRGLVIIPVVVLVLAAAGAFVYGTFVFVHSVSEVVDHPLPVGSQVGLFLVDVDLFLIGATLLIAAIGLYELFISRVDVGSAPRMPRWLEMRDLNDLKARVIAMIILVVTVSFAELVVDVANSRQILEVGGGVAVVVTALTVFLRYGSQERGDRSPPSP